MHGSITDEDRQFVETWENLAEGTNGILRLDARGEARHEMISGKRNFMLTTQERLITQDRIVVKDLDPFLNGSFRPVVVPDSVTTKSNPNALSDEEISKILQSSDIAWTEWMTQINSVATLRRMMELADEVDGVSMKRYREIERRLVDVRPNQIQSNDEHLRSFLEQGRGEERQPTKIRQRGGRSSDYR